MLITLITVTYNSAATLPDTLQSVLDQSYPDIEYWIIDGGSKDQTLEVIRQWEPRFPGRLHYISEPDKGIYDAMNKGIALSQGDVIGILNSDDFFSSSDVLSRVVDAFVTAPELQAVYGDVHFVHPDDLTHCTRYYSGRLYRPYLAPYGFMPPHPSLYVRREVYQQFGAYRTDFRISSDYEFMTRIFLCHHVPHRYLHLDMVTMRTGGTSTNSFKTRELGTAEDLQACLDLGIPTNRFKIRVKYLIKAFSMLFIRS